jgi:hypothetical protein
VRYFRSGRRTEPSTGSLLHRHVAVMQDVSERVQAFTLRGGVRMKRALVLFAVLLLLFTPPAFGGVPELNVNRQ